MFRRLFLVGGLCACLLRADFAYEQSSKITGGMIAGMMKFAGAFSSKARQPMKSTVLVKGNRLAMVSADNIQIIDLDKETMTVVDMDKKTYAVATFAEMAQAMARAAEKAGQAGQAKADPNADVNLKVDVKNTGESRVIGGFNTKQVLMTIDLEGKDKQSGQTGAMRVTLDSWLAPKIAGYDEVQDFYKRMSQKMAWSPGGGMLAGVAAARPELSKGLAQAAAEMSKVDGIPVFQITRMGMAGEGTAAGAPSQPAAQQQQQPAPSASESATGAALGRLGKLGGFGGFGKKKKEEKPEETAPAAQTPQSSGDASGALMVMETELSGFSSAAIDPSRLDVPAGFKQIEHPIKRSLK